MWRTLKISMPRVDVPELTRCCFCLPLRYGLLAWGYLKMIFLSLLVYQLIRDLIYWGPYTAIIIITIILLVDIMFNVIFIVAGHLKHEQLYLVYYYYSAVVFYTYLLYMTGFTCWNWFYYNDPSMVIFFHLALQVFTSFLPILLVQGYVTLLVRTEARKLGNSSNFEFVNKAAEPTCTVAMAGSTIVPPTTH